MNDDNRTGATTPAAPDRRTLARATLAHLADGADPIMHAMITGTGEAAEALRLIIESRPDADDGRAGTTSHLNHLFAAGLARSGRRPTPERMRAFRKALTGWHARLASLPSTDWETLGGWLTAQGRQWIIAPHSPHWPRQLDDLSMHGDWAAPLCLWGIGDARALTGCDKPLAVVGSRGATDYGRTVARRIAMHAAADGHLIVSGGAMGIDAAAHWGALAAIDERRTDDGRDETTGRTAAVFAGGLDHIGPASNMRLFERIVAHGGVLISEHRPGTIPEARRFLLRNRIIAALASTVVVAQARLRSGALNTANWAYELNREVIAVPGEITTPYHAGCNRIISRHQAMLLNSPEEITELLHPSHRPAAAAAAAATAAATSSTPSAAIGPGTEEPERDAGQGPTGEQRLVLAAIASRARRRAGASIDDLLSYLAEDDPPWPARRLLTCLGELELLGMIRRDDEGGIRLATEKQQKETRDGVPSNPPGKGAQTPAHPA